MERDIDGMMDGIYKHAVDLLVQGEDGIAVTVTITTDWEPKFTARRVA